MVSIPISAVYYCRIKLWASSPVLELCFEPWMTDNRILYYIWHTYANTCNPHRYFVLSHTRPLGACGHPTYILTSSYFLLNLGWAKLYIRVSTEIMQRRSSWTGGRRLYRSGPVRRVLLNHCQWPITNKHYSMSGWGWMRGLYFKWKLSVHGIYHDYCNEITYRLTPSYRELKVTPPSFFTFLLLPPLSPPPPLKNLGHFGRI